MKKSNSLLIILLIVILIQALFLITRKEPIEVIPFDDTELRLEIQEKDSIAKYWINRSNVFQSLAIKFQIKSDSLEQLKSKIKIYYNEIYRELPHATNQQLDSILRANW